MFARLSAMRKSVRAALFGLAALGLAACDASLLGPIGVGGGAGGGGRVDPGQPLQVALLLPQSDAGAAPVAASLERAVRLAIAENTGADIRLAVYDTAGSAGTAAAQAQRAVDEGARIILGPLFGEAANAAGLAVLDEGVNVLSFSNNPSIAGGNVFVLGPTFANTANRLFSYARRQGKQNVAIVYSDDVPGQFGRSAAEGAAGRNGLRIVTAQGYPLSIEGVRNTAEITARTGASADTVFLTTDATNAAMPMLLRGLPEAGLAPGSVQYIGLTRWDVRPDLFNLPGAEGAWFALPDQGQQDAFNARYRSAYGSEPHPLAGLGYDGISAIATLVAAGRGDALSGRALTSSVFRGTGGAFQLTPDGANRRALAVAAVRNRQVVILEPAPNGFGAGF